VRDGAAAIGLTVRAGLHLGEVQTINGKVGGIAVHIGARIAAAAEPGEVLVSSTVKALVAGSGLEFEDRGEQLLKGVPEPWRLFAVAGYSGATPDTAGRAVGRAETPAQRAWRVASGSPRASGAMWSSWRWWSRRSLSGSSPRPALHPF